jgi:cell division transport system permease protein
MSGCRGMTMRTDPGASGGLVAWLDEHQRAFMRSLRRRLRAPLATLLLVTGVGLLLAIPGYLWVVLDSGRALSAELDHEPRISLYFEVIDPESLRRIATVLSDDPAIARARFQHADSVLAAYRDQLPDPGWLDWLDVNPLPSVLEIVPQDLAPEAVQILESMLKSRFPEAVMVTDVDWLLRLRALHRAGLQVFLVLSALLIAALITVLAITTVSDLVSRRQEISVARIMGATDRFLRRPSLYDGFLAGISSGFVGFWLLLAGVAVIREPIDAMAETFGWGFVLMPPGAEVLAVLLLIGGVAGWLGARIGSDMVLRVQAQ